MRKSQVPWTQPQHSNIDCFGPSRILTLTAVCLFCLFVVCVPVLSLLVTEHGVATSCQSLVKPLQFHLAVGLLVLHRRAIL